MGNEFTTARQFCNDALHKCTHTFFLCLVEVSSGNGGSRISQRGQLPNLGVPIIWAIFPENYMKMKEIGLRDGVAKDESMYTVF